MTRNPSVLKLLRAVKGESLACMRARVAREMKVFAARNIQRVKFQQANHGI